MNNAPSHDLQSLGRFVIEHPEDLDARRVYADLLIENSDPRGEFILHQFQMEEAELWSPAYIKAKLESENLLLMYRDSWESEWKQLLLETFPGDELLYRGGPREPYISYDVGYAYRYGFIDEFGIGLGASLENIELIRDVHPIRKIAFKGHYNDKAFVGHESIRSIRRFTYNVINESDQFRSFLKFIDQPKIIELKTRFVVGLSEATTYLQRATFESLTTLDLGSMKFTDDELSQIASSPWFENIEHLPLVGNTVGEKTAAAFKNSKVTQSLKSLNLKLTNANDSILKSIADDGLPKLQRLGLGWWFGSNPSVKGLELILQSDVMPNLESLDLNSWTMKSPALRLIASSPLLANLKHLHFPDLNDEQIELFHESTITNLDLLNLSSLNLSAKTICRILDGNVGQGVKVLNLSGVKSLAESTEGVFESPAMDSLLYLDLSRGAISNQTFDDLIHSDRLSNLLGLNLQGCELSKRKIGTLLNSNLTSLKHVRVYLNPKNDLAKKFRRQLPGLCIHSTQS